MISERLLSQLADVELVRARVLAARLQATARAAERQVVAELGERDDNAGGGPGLVGGLGQAGGAISFGAYNPLSATPTDATAQVSLDCTGVVSLFGLVEVRAGTGNSGNATQRTLTRGANSLSYNLYGNSSRSQILADGLSGTTTLTTTLNGLLFFSTSVPVYARIPAGQWVASGTYTDTVVITVLY